jgi:hypothetical protein
MPMQAWIMNLLLILHSLAEWYVPASIPSHWLRWDLANYLSRLTSNHDLLISTYQVSRITGISHNVWPSFLLFLIFSVHFHSPTILSFSSKFYLFFHTIISYILIKYTSPLLHIFIFSSLSPVLLLNS